MPRSSRVLVVDDWEGTREALRLLLEDWSCAVDIADDREEGRRLASNGNYDAVMLLMGHYTMLNGTRTLAHDDQPREDPPQNEPKPEPYGHVDRHTVLRVLHLVQE